MLNKIISNLFAKTNNEIIKSEREIKRWLDKHKITNYKLISNEYYGFVVNVDGNVHLNTKKLKFIPIKFNEVIGNFDCGNNELTSLKNCPEKVSGNFFCFNNKFKTLEFCPKEIGGDFNANNNHLLHLNDFPEFVGGEIWISFCDIESGFNTFSFDISFEKIKNYRLNKKIDTELKKDIKNKINKI